MDRLVQVKRSSGQPSPTTQPMHSSSGPWTYQWPRTVFNALDQGGPEPLPAQRNPFSLIIVAGIVPSYGQGTRQSHFRNDPMKYDLNVIAQNWDDYTDS